MGYVHSMHKALGNDLPRPYDGLDTHHSLDLRSLYDSSVHMCELVRVIW